MGRFARCITEKGNMTKGKKAGEDFAARPCGCQSCRGVGGVAGRGDRDGWVEMETVRCGVPAVVLGIRCFSLSVVVPCVAL